MKLFKLLKGGFTESTEHRASPLRSKPTLLQMLVTFPENHACNDFPVSQSDSLRSLVWDDLKKILLLQYLQFKQSSVRCLLKSPGAVPTSPKILCLKGRVQHSFPDPRGWSSPGPRVSCSQWGSAVTATVVLPHLSDAQRVKLN